MADLESNFLILYAQVKKIFGGATLSTTQILILSPRIVAFIQEAGAVSQLSGAEKKHLFLEIVKKMIAESDLPDEEKQTLQMFADSLLPLIVDGLVYAYKSDTFDKIRKRTKKCLPCLP